MTTTTQNKTEGSTHDYTAVIEAKNMLSESEPVLNYVKCTDYGDTVK